MNIYEVSLGLEIEAMHEESAENKLEAFLAGLDLKKNDKVFCNTVGPIIKAGSDESPEKEEIEDEWQGIEEDEWQGIEEEDWDTLGVDETPSTPPSEEAEEAEEVEVKPEEVEDEHGFNVILKQINNPTIEEPSEDDSEIEEDWWIAD